MKNYFTPPTRHPAFRLFLLSIGCIFISSFLSIPSVYGQLNGTYTIGGSDAHYSNFSEAVQALNTHGISAPVTFKVRPGAYQEQLRIPPFAGSSCENTVTFESESSSPNEVFLNPHSAEGAVLQISGADGITIRNLNIAAPTSSMIEVSDGSDCIKLENNIVRGNIQIHESSNQVIIEDNSISGSIRALSGPGDLGSHGHIYRNNQLSESIIKEKSGEFQPADPDFDEGLEIIGNTVPRGIVLSAQKDIRLNDNTIAVPEEAYEGAGISLTNCWYGQELMGNTIDIKSHRALARGIDAVNGIPELVSENRITLREGRVLTIPGTKPATPGYGGGTAVRFSTGPTTNHEVLFANNIIDVSGADYREQLRTLTGFHITEAHAQINAIRFYHNSIHIHGSIDSGIPIGILAEPLPTNLLHLVNNLFLLDAINMSGQHVQGDPLWSKSENVVAVWEHNYEIYDIKEGDSPKGTYLPEVPKDFYGQLRADPPFVGAIEGSAPEEPEPPTPGEPLAGSYTIGGQEADFSNFSEAMTALNERGKSSGELIFRIRPGTYTEQVHIHSANGLVFEGQAGDSTAVVLQYFGAPVVSVSRSHITFRNMTISGTGWQVINIGDDVSHFRLESNIIQGTRGSILVSSHTIPEGQSNHHSYEKNMFSGGAIGLQKTHGMDAWHWDRRDNHLFIKDNLFQGQTLKGIQLMMQNEVEIENNRILLEGSEEGILIQFSTNVRKVNDNIISSQGGTGILFDGSQPAEILRNKITLTGPGSGLHIDFHSNNLPVSIVNNMISVKAGSLTNNRRNNGIFLYGLGNASVYFNSVHVYGEEEQSAAIRLQSWRNDIRMANNIFSNTAGGPALDIQDIESVDWASHNAYYHTGDTIRLGQQDVFADPGFLADDNLIPTNSDLDNAGMAISGIETDFFGQQRNDPPTIGAVEMDGVIPTDPLALVPFVECVVRNRDGSYTATLGYHNPNPQTVELAIGNQNFLNLMEYAGQPNSFAPGRHERAFHVMFEASESLSWTLGDTTLTVDRNSPACEEAIIQPVEPRVSCVSELDRTLYLATLGYYNPNDAPVAIAAGRLNRMSGRQDQGQPTVFEPGLQEEAFAASYSGTLMWTLADQRVMVNRDIPACSPALQVVQPILECVSDNGDGTYTAHFGYYNPNAIAVSTGSRLHNLLLPAFPGIDEVPGTFEPGRNERAFSVPFRGQRLEWRLMGNTVTATRSADLDCENAFNARTAGLAEEPVVGAKGVEVYPNPFSKTVQISLGGQAAEKVNIRIYALSGLLVVEKNTTNNSKGIQLDLDQLGAGTYILEVESGEVLERIRLLKP